MLHDLAEPAISALPILIAIYAYCVGRILILGMVGRDSPEVFLTPVVLGQDLQFWLSACNLLWILFIAVHLLTILSARGGVKKTGVLLALLALSGFLLLEFGMPVVFQVMADWRSAQ